MSYQCDMDGPEFFSEEIRTARLEHQCCECSAPILVGERYYAQSGKWDGYLDSFAQHLLCRDACVWIRDVLEGECIAFGGLSEWWSETERYGLPADGPKRRIGAGMMAMIVEREQLDQRPPRREPKIEARP